MTGANFSMGLITQDIAHLSPESPIFTCLLTPQGKILFEFCIYDSGNACLVDCNSAAAAALLKRLTLYKLRAKVSIERNEGLSVIVSDRGTVGQADLALLADPRSAAMGLRGNTEATFPVDDGGYLSRAIAAGIPEFGRDFQSDEGFSSRRKLRCSERRQLQKRMLRRSGSH